MFVFEGKEKILMSTKKFDNGEVLVASHRD
jgi:hypothetical protein